MTITIEIDELPQSEHLLGVPDYSARQIMSAGFSSLFHVDEQNVIRTSRLIRKIQHSEASHEVSIFLAADAMWSDGRRVSNQDVAYTLVMATRSPLWRNHLCCLNKVELRGEDELVLSSRWTVDHLKRLLAIPELSPSRPECTLSSGPFSGRFMLRRCDAGMEAVPNPLISANLSPTIVFRLNREPRDSLNLYEEGAIDVTCNTALPLEMREEFRCHPDYHRGATGIYMQLEFCPNGHQSLRDVGVRRRLSEAICREGLVRHLGSAFSPAFGYEGGATISKRGPSEPCQTTWPSTLKAMVIDCHQYTPNFDVAEYVAHCWEKALGLDTTVVTSSFSEDAAVNADLQLRLRFCSYPHWYASISHYLGLVGMLAPEAVSVLVSSCDAALRSGESCPAEVQAAIEECVPAIPLLRMDGHWLQRPTIAGFTYPDNGCFDFSAIRRM